MTPRYGLLTDMARILGEVCPALTLMMESLASSQAYTAFSNRLPKMTQRSVSEIGRLSGRLNAKSDLIFLLSQIVS